MVPTTAEEPAAHVPLLRSSDAFDNDQEVDSRVEGHPDEPCLRKYFNLLKDELLLRQDEHARMDGLLSQVNQCQTAECSRKVDSMIFLAERLITKSRSARRSVRNALPCSGLAREALHANATQTGAPVAETCVQQYFRLYQTDHELQTSEEKKISRLSRRLAACESGHCRRKFQRRLSKARGEYAQNRQDRAAEMAGLPCVDQAKAVLEAEARAGLYQDGSLIARSATDGSLLLPVWAIPLIVIAGLILVALVIIVVILFHSKV